MLQMVGDLIRHKAHANAALLTAIQRDGAASADSQVRELLHHVLLANRFWLFTICELPFVLEEESAAPSSLDILIERYRRTHEQEAAWMTSATEADLTRVLAHPLIPGGTCSVANALMQVCMHSHGHRAQCAKLLRRHGAVPPATDFILWLVDRPTAEWPLPESV